ncbi:MAG: putative rane protein [Pseudonocardiales bacterium]|jgi:putative membrane protein|nr:putative rane protein [Pseudonocardiales bacterium]
MGSYGGGMHGGEWLTMILMMVAFWGVVVALVVWAVRTLRSDEPRGSAHDSGAPEGILAERFARGEIDDDEFRRRRDALVGAGAAGDGRL